MISELFVGIALPVMAFVVWYAVIRFAGSVVIRILDTWRTSGRKDVMVIRCPMCGQSVGRVIGSSIFTGHQE
jgi:hypothetical protein